MRLRSETAPNLVVCTLVAWVVFCVGGGISEARAVATLDVAARTSLTLEATSIGREVTIRGQLVDDADAPVAYRRVTIDGRATQAASAFETEAMTDDEGRFALQRVLPVGAWRFDAQFVGDYFLDDASAAVSSTSRETPLRVRIDVPSVIAVSAERVVVRIRVMAGETPVPELAFQWRASCGRVVEPTTTDGGGVARAILEPRDVAGGPCTIEATVVTGRRFPPASGQTQIRRVVSPSIRVVGRHERQGLFSDGSWNVSATLTDPHGPVPGATMQLWLDDVAVAEDVADQRGDTRFVVSDTDVGDGVEARVGWRSDDGITELRSDPIRLQPPPSPSHAFGWLSAGLCGLFGVILVFALRRESREHQPVVAPRQRVAQVAVGPTPHDDGEWMVEVVDADTGEAVVAAHIDSAAYDDRHGHMFSLGSRKRASLHITAPGYVPATVDLRSPRAGHRTLIRLRTVRAEVREVLRQTVAAIDEQERGWWGRRSPAEAGKRVAKQLALLRRSPRREALQRAELRRLLQLDPRERVEAFEALTLLVDRVYFGGEGNDEAVLALARRLAAEVEGSS